MAFTGQVVELPLGTEGLTGTTNLSAVNPGYLREATNISYYDGTLRKEGGASKYNSSAITGAPSILGGWDWYTNALAQRMIVACSDGKLYKDTGGGTFGVTLKSGLSASMKPFFVDGGKEAAANDRKLFIFTGTNVVQVLADDGATTTDISGPPSDWAAGNQPTFGAIHAGRLMAGGNANDPHRIYISSATNHADFTTSALSFSIFAGEGLGLTGAMSFKGYLVLWKKPRGIYILDTTDPSITNWVVRRITRSVGAPGPYAMTQTEDDIVFMDTTAAIQSIQAVQEFGDVAGHNLSQQSMMEPLLRSSIELSRLDQVRAVYYVAKRELHFAFPTDGNTVNDSRLVLDFYREDKIRYRISPRDICVSLWLRRDGDGIPRLQAGDNAGFVWLLDQASRAKDGLPYPSIARTVPTDFGYADPNVAHRRKNACFLELVYEPTTTSTVSVDLEWDGVPHETVDFGLINSGVPLGNFVLGVDALGGTKISYTSIRRITGGGKYLSLTFRNSGLNQDFSIARARVYFTLGRE